MKRTNCIILFLFIFILNLFFVKLIDAGSFAILIFFPFLLFVLLTKNWHLLHCIIFFTFFAGVTSVFPNSGINKNPPMLSLFLILVSTAVILPFKTARSSLSWFRVGNIDTVSVVLVLTFGIISSAVLIVWANWTDDFGIAGQMIEAVKKYPKLFLFVIGFPIVALNNSLFEEIIFRGILQEALTNTYQSKVLVIVLQATVFASFYFVHGLPNGVIGYLMALVFGIISGYLKHTANGLLAPVTMHFIADIAICYYLAIKIL